MITYLNLKDTKMDIRYFQKINNCYQSSSKQETELFLINRNEERYLYDNIDKKDILLNGKPFELLVIKGTSDNKKKIKAKHSTSFCLGDYITWNNQIWLVTSLDPDDKTHHNGVMSLCTVPLRWQKENGEIIERWAYSEDFTKYDSGEISNGIITVASNQYGFTVPIDNETKLLTRRSRFVIDILEEVDYKNGFIPDTYRLSNRKVCLNNNQYFGRGGTMILTMIFDSFNPSTDKYIDLGNGNYGWICGLKEENSSNLDPKTNFICNIKGKNTIIGGYQEKWTAIFPDDNNINNEQNNINWSFNIISDFNIEQTLFKDKKQIELKVDKQYIGKTFTLELLVKNTVVHKKDIQVIGL